jgi:signal transduction histidine kinase
LRSNAEDLAERVLQEGILREKAERAVRSRDEMLRVVSHDLRNPLGNIKLAASMLASADTTEDRKPQLLEMIQRLATRVNRIIQDLIEIAKAESGQPMPLDLGDVSALAVTQEACTLNRMSAERKRVRLHCDGSSNTVVRADHHRILQALSNLIDNAIKFSPENGHIGVTAGATDGGVEFLVTDSGAGIPESQMKDIFRPFWKDERRPEAGIGLGLAIVKKIVELHGGRIQVRNEPGTGCTFSFWIPAGIVSRQRSA